MRYYFTIEQRNAIVVQYVEDLPIHQRQDIEDVARWSEKKFGAVVREERLSDEDTRSYNSHFKYYTDTESDLVTVLLMLDHDE